MKQKDRLREMLIQVPCRCALSAVRAESEIDDMYDEFESGKFDNVSWRAGEIHEIMEEVEDKCTIDLSDVKNILSELIEKADESSKFKLAEVSVGLVSKIQDCAD